MFLLLISVELSDQKLVQIKQLKTYRTVAASEITATGPVHRFETPTSQFEHKPVQKLFNQLGHKPVQELVDDPSRRSVLVQM